MGDLVNLNKARKARDRTEAKAEASKNRARHGLTKAQRRIARAERDQLDGRLDGAKLDDA